MERHAQKNREIVRSIGFDVISNGISEQLTIIRMLRGDVSAERPFIEAVRDEEGLRIPDFGTTGDAGGEDFLRFARAIGEIRELHAMSIMGRHEAGTAAVAQSPLWAVPTQFERAEYQFYDALSHAALCGASSGQQREQHLEALQMHYRQVVVWARSGPVTFATRAALLGAEIARLEGRAADAGDLYEEAIRSARQNGFVQNEALASERAAYFYYARGIRTAAEAYVRRARDCYLQWGANGKVQQLEQAYPSLRPGAQPSVIGTVGAPVEQFDLETVLKVSQALSEEIELPKAIDTLMTIALEHAGADRSLLILPHGDELLIEAEASTSRDAVTVQGQRKPLSPRDLPESILRYVRRTRDSVLLDDTAEANAFSDDAYIQAAGSRSILCLPLSKPGKLVGILYLENSETAHDRRAAPAGLAGGNLARECAPLRRSRGARGEDPAPHRFRYHRHLHVEPRWRYSRRQ